MIQSSRRAFDVRNEDSTGGSSGCDNNCWLHSNEAQKLFSSQKRREVSFAFHLDWSATLTLLCQLKLLFAWLGRSCRRFQLEWRTINQIRPPRAPPDQARPVKPSQVKPVAQSSPKVSSTKPFGTETKTEPKLGSAWLD